MSYHAYWSLRKLPFARPDSPDAFYSGGPQREALARFEYLITGGHGAGLLIGPAGTGRTTLLRRLASSAGFGDAAVDVVYTATRRGAAADMLGELAVRLGIAPRPGDPMRQIVERIDAASRQRVRTVWLLDDAQGPIISTAGAICAAHPWATVVVSCTPERAMKVAAELRGCALRIDLQPLELEETFAYVRHALQDAGGRTEIFSDAALVRLHELSHGRIAIAARMAELALLAGASQRADCVRPELIEAADAELVRAA